MKIFILLFIVTQFSWAQDSAKVQVKTYDDYEAKDFKNKDVDAQDGTPAERSLIADLPDPARTKELIKQSNLEKEMSGKDQIFFDILMSRLLRENFSETKKRYPKIDSSKLMAFKKLLEAEK